MSSVGLRCPITGCDTVITVTVALALGGGPDVLPRRQVLDTAPATVRVHAELGTDATEQVRDHLRTVHGYEMRTPVNGDVSVAHRAIQYAGQAAGITCAGMLEHLDLTKV